MLERLKSIARRAFGEDVVWFWWQNLSRDEGKGDAPFHGRATLTLCQRHALQFSWNLWSRFAHAGVDVDQADAAVGLKVALPPVALWLTFESWPLLHKWTSRTGDRVVGISAHDDTVWWRLWVDPNEWHSNTPRWRDGNFHLVDALLGKAEVKRELVGDLVNILVPMPEGVYAGTCQMERVTVGRSRWFEERFSTAKIEMRDPIPEPGKGENSWDCDEDATYGMSMPARSPAHAVAELVRSVLVTRERRGGLSWMPEPKAA